MRERPTPQRVKARRALGRCLVMARERLNLDQTKVAEDLAVSRQTLSNWERGLGEPLALDLVHLAALYEVTLEQLVGLASIPPPRSE